jgi:hypothetical protein
MNNDFLPELISLARKKHGDILPLRNAHQAEDGRLVVGGLKSWDECITVEDNIVRLWYNSMDRSTHIVACAYRDAAEGEHL